MSELELERWGSVEAAVENITRPQLPLLHRVSPDTPPKTIHMPYEFLDVLSNLCSLIPPNDKNNRHFTSTKSARRHSDFKWCDLDLLKFLRAIRLYEPSSRLGWAIQSVSVMWHSRKEDEMIAFHTDEQVVGEEFDIYAVSGDDYKVHLRASAAVDEIQPLDVSTGRMYTMSGTYRKDWQHGVEWQGGKRCIRVGYSASLE